MNSALLSNGAESNVNGNNLNFYLQPEVDNRIVDPSSIPSASKRENDLFDG